MIMETNSALQAAYRYNQLLVEKLSVLPKEMSLDTWMRFLRESSVDITAYEEFLVDPRPLAVTTEVKKVKPEYIWWEELK